MDMLAPFKSISYQTLGRILRDRAKSGSGKGYHHEPNRMNRKARRRIQHMISTLELKATRVRCTQAERDEMRARIVDLTALLKGPKMHSAVASADNEYKRA